MGIDHSTHRALIYGPSEYGGFGVRHLYTEMMGMKVESIVSHIRAGTELGTSFIININHIQLLSGIGEPIFMSKADISYNPMNWLLHVRQFLWEINATMDIKDLWLPRIQCENDQFLMTAFVSMRTSKAELVILNNWRLYYKLILLSEICFASGQGIKPYYLEYDHDKLPRNRSPNISWPVQGKPDEATFRIWKRYLRSCFLNYNNHRPPTLGAWDIPEILQT
jgi:hypothetical protein